MEMVQPDIPHKSSSSLNNKRLTLPLWEYPAWASFVCIRIQYAYVSSPETSGALDELWYLTPLSLLVCGTQAHCTMCTFIFRVAALWWGSSSVAKGLQWEGHSSNSKYVSTVHPSPSGWQLIQNAHHQVGSSTCRHVRASRYSQIHLQASAFEHSPTMLMRGSKGGGIRERWLVIGRPARKQGLKVTCQSDTTFSFDPSTNLSYPKCLICGRRPFIGLFTDIH